MNSTPEHDWTRRYVYVIFFCLYLSFACRVHIARSNQCQVLVNWLESIKFRERRKMEFSLLRECVCGGAHRRWIPFRQPSVCDTITFGSNGKTIRPNTVTHFVSSIYLVCNLSTNTSHIHFFFVFFRRMWATRVDQLIIEMMVFSVEKFTFNSGNDSTIVANHREQHFVTINIVIKYRSDF